MTKTDKTVMYLSLVACIVCTLVAVALVAGIR